LETKRPRVLEIEQEMSRPYAYTSIMHVTGTNIISARGLLG